MKLMVKSAKFFANDVFFIFRTTGKLGGHVFVYTGINECLSILAWVMSTATHFLVNQNVVSKLLNKLLVALNWTAPKPTRLDFSCLSRPQSAY